MHPLRSPSLLLTCLLLLGAACARPLAPEDGAPEQEPAPRGEGEGEGEGDGDGEGEGEGEGEGDGSEGEGDPGPGEGEGEGDAGVGEGEGDSGNDAVLCTTLSACCDAVPLFQSSCTETAGAGDEQACANKLDLFSQIPGEPCPPSTAIGFPPVPEPVGFDEEVEVTDTIVIDEAGDYDFHGKMHVWQGSGSCNQTENQPPILHIAHSNVTVRNFGYRNAPDGIHIGAAVGAGQGYNAQASVSNVVLDNVVGYACEDALTTQANTHHITIQNSFFYGNPDEQYRDKILQLNFADDVTIENTLFQDSPRPVLFKGGSTITVRGSYFHRVEQGLYGDTEGSHLGLMQLHAHIECTSEGNFFADFTNAFLGVGDVHFTSTGDSFREGPHDQMEQGASIDYP